MGNFFEEKDGEFQFQELILSAFLIFTALFYIAPSVSFLGIFFSLFILFGIFLFFRGLVEFTLGIGTTRMLLGAALITFVIFMFPNGLYVVQTLLRALGL